MAIKNGKLLHWGLLLICTYGFFIFIQNSNIFDWDHFLSSFEVDRRSWVNDLTPPTWSYQFCAGVSRIGDPQAFGLSPLFLFIIVLGSYWGSKALLLFCFTMGFYFVRKILLLLANEQSAAMKSMASSISMMFILGNYFLWHLHQGHITFALLYLGFGIVYYFLKSSISGLSKRHLLLSNVLVWAVFSAGFYPLAIYFFLPLGISALLFSLLQRELLRTNLKIFLASTMPGLALASYKWIPSLIYQLQFPRTLSDTRVEEVGGLFKTLIYHFSPTINLAYWGRYPSSEIEDGLSYGIWEYSAFSTLNWILIIVGLLIVLLPKVSRADTPSSKRLPVFLFIYLSVSILFSLGDNWPFLPHAILNQLLGDSVRAVGRYQIGISVVLALTVWHIVVTRNLHRFYSAFSLALLLSLLNMKTFASLQPPKVIENVNAMPQMRQIKLVTPPDYYGSNMYTAIMQGFAVANCYNPLVRSRNFSSGFSLEEMTKEPIFHFIKDVDENSACAKNSYFTQSDVVLDPTCPKDLKLNFNSMKTNVFSK